IGFAPQIQNGGGAASTGAVHDQFGAQIDMRQVYLTVGDPKWGQILAGRELALFGRQNILNDQTLFGVGAVGIGGGGAGGTTLGRIGYGYIYPNFVPQLTYSTKPGQSQLSIGLFQPSILQGGGGGTPYLYTKVRRCEADSAYNQKSAENSTTYWLEGRCNTPP